MNFRRLKAVFRKELLHIVRDPRSLGLALAMPVVLLLMFGYALTLDVDRVPTLVHDRDESPQSRELIQRLEGSRYFTLMGNAETYDEVQAAIDNDRVLLGVVIPEDFSDDLNSGREAEVQLLIDGSDSNTASLTLGYVEALVAIYSAELTQEFQERHGMTSVPSPVDARIRVMFNPDMESRNYIVPGIIAVILMIIAALLTSLTIAREWEMGTMEQLLSTPLRSAELLLGKVLAFFLVGLVDVLIAIAIGLGIFQVPFRGSPLLLMISSSIFLFGALCWGILLSTVTRSQLLAFQAGLTSSFLPAFLLSGFVFSIDNMPKVIQAVTHIVPARYFVTILKGVFLKGIGVAVLWSELLFLVLYATVVFLLAVRKLGNKVA